MLKISIITVTFNNVKTIEQTIKSVLNQNYSNLEYIVIDGGSKDGALEILNKYKNKFNYFKSSPDEGVFDAMNKGISEATGDLIGFVNGDDFLYENILQEINNLFYQKEKNLFFSVAGVDYIDDENNVIGSRTCRPTKQILSRKYLEMPSNHLGCFVPLKAFKEVGLFETKFPYRADWLFILLLIKKGYMPLHLEKKVGGFRLGGQSGGYAAFLENFKIVMLTSGSFFISFYSIFLSFSKLFVRRNFPRFYNFVFKQYYRFNTDLMQKEIFLPKKINAIQISGERHLMKNKFKVIHVISSPCGGGAELLVRELTKQTNELGINCKAIYFNYWAECAKTIGFSDNEQSLNIGYRNPLAVIALRKLFKLELVEHSNLIVHAHLTWPMFFVPLACLGLPVKLIFTEHSTSNKRRNFSIFKYIERTFYNRYNSIIAITDGAKDRLLNWLGSGLSNKVSTIFNGARFFSYKERKPLGKCIKFISVGSLRPLKGFDKAIKALSQLEGLDWQYEIIGEGSSRRELEQLIVSLGLQDKVTLFGWSSKLEEKYHNADIQLIPSRFEGFGLVAIEGMSTGLPIIASDLVGINEVVSSSLDSCFLVKDSNDISEWINKIKLCINSLEKDLVHISKESYLHSQKFSLEKMTKSYIDLYREVLQK